MRKIVNRTVYDTEKAKCIATNDFRDGNNKWSGGRSSSLYRTKKGNYFIEHNTSWQGEHDSLQLCEIEKAEEVFEEMSTQKVEYEEAFPENKLEEA